MWGDIATLVVALAPVELREGRGFDRENDPVHRRPRVGREIEECDVDRGPVAGFRVDVVLVARQVARVVHRDLPPAPVTAQLGYRPAGLESLDQRAVAEDELAYELLARLVLEGDREPDPVLLDLAVLDRDVLPNHLGDPQVADALGRGLDRVGRGLRPSIGAGPDYLGNAVDTASHTGPPIVGAGPLDSFRLARSAQPRGGRSSGRRGGSGR